MVEPATKRPVLLVVLVVGAALLGGLLLWPSPVDAAAFQPLPLSKLDDNGARVDDILEQATLLETGGDGPESVVRHENGDIYTGLDDGRIVRFDAKQKKHDVVNTQGRPLGLAFDAEGALIICDAKKGLLRVVLDNNFVGHTIDVLAAEHDGVPFGFTNDLDIAADGRIFFSDASTKFGIENYMFDLFEARPHGRLLVYDPATQKTALLADKLYFANGVALAQDESFVVVNETYRFRMKRHWLKGDKAGTTDVFVDNVPGYADGLTRDAHGRFVVGLFSTRKAIADRIAPHPFIKETVAKLPKALWPKPNRVGAVWVLSTGGEPLFSVVDADGSKFHSVSSAQITDGHLLFGQLKSTSIGVMKLPDTLRDELGQ